MPKLKPLSTKQFICVVEKCGYFFVRQKGSHQVFSNKQGSIVTVRIHTGKIDSQTAYWLKFKINLSLSGQIQN